jgi:hypothetical protein
VLSSVQIVNQTPIYIKKILTESTRVSANHRDLVDLELQNALDVEVHVLPLAVVVTELSETSTSYPIPPDELSIPNDQSIFQQRGRLIC